MTELYDKYFFENEHSALKKIIHIDTSLIIQRYKKQTIKFGFKKSTALDRIIWKKNSMI